MITTCDCSTAALNINNNNNNISSFSNNYTQHSKNGWFYNFQVKHFGLIINYFLLYFRSKLCSLLHIGSAALGVSMGIIAGATFLFMGRILNNIEYSENISFFFRKYFCWLVGCSVISIILYCSPPAHSCQEIWTVKILQQLQVWFQKWLKMQIFLISDSKFCLELV